MPKGDVEVFVRDPTQFPPGRGDRKRGQELAVCGELLHAGIGEIGDKHFVGPIDGDADREIEFPIFRSAPPPFEQECQLFRSPIAASGRGGTRDGQARIRTL